jgi:serine/threonine-protein kinase RsbW
MISQRYSSQYDKFFCLDNDLALVAGLVTSVIETLPKVQADNALLQLVLTEALNNAVVHGNGANADKKVVLGYRVSADVLLISVLDEGGGLSAEMIAAAEMPDGTAESGRGIALIRSIAPDVYIEDGILNIPFLLI